MNLTSNLPGSAPILVVDDDIVCRELLAAILENLGYQVVTAADGNEAFEAICGSDIRIVLSDWQMPGMSGVELCAKVRQRQLSSYVYFILLTTLSRTGHVIRGLRAGADDFLTKPCHPEELQARLAIAERIVSLENKQLLVFSLARLAESRDPDTGTHLERMRDYSRLLAAELSRTPRYRDDIDADYIRTLFLTSPLHDIGKVGIPDSVLLKPGKLTAEEFEIMKQHVVIGRDTLDAALASDPTAQYLRFARDIAAGHHEKFDGSGYPDRLVGEDIPLSARIVAVADVYDALTNKRVYKEAMSHDQARSIIVEGRGSHFDPEIVEAFLRIEQDFVAVRAADAKSITTPDSPGRHVAAAMSLS